MDWKNSGDTKTTMKIKFVLVEPAVPENIGASARALKTMGFDTLQLVNPAEWKEGKARQVAHGSTDILDKAVIFNSLSEALAGSNFAVATSASARKIKKDIISSADLTSFLIAKSEHINSVALVFGREEYGLSNEELKLCDIVSAIPMKVGFPSLNLAQAVMIYAYELSGLNKNCGKMNENHAGIPSGEPYSVLKEKTAWLLLRLGLVPTDNRYGRIMERIAFLKGVDLNLALTICNLLKEKLDTKS